jgi:hypothetical protein
MQDPVIPLRATAKIAWPVPARRAPWLATVSGAIKQAQADAASRQTESARGDLSAEGRR